MKGKTSQDAKDKLWGMIILGGLLVVLWPLVFGGGGERRDPWAAATPSAVRVEDGDTVSLAAGSDVPPLRLLQVNAPELDQCYGRRSRAALARRVQRADTLAVREDETLEADRYERRLAYLYAGETNLNVWMVRHGYARVYFIDGERGEYAAELRAAEKTARRHERGLWKACRA